MSDPDESGVSRDLPRGRLLGGCSSTNATFALRGHPADYDSWAAAGLTGWSYADTLPYFARLETDLDLGGREWHGASGPVPIRRYPAHELSDVASAGLEAFTAAGLPEVVDHNAPDAIGVGPAPVNCLDRLRVSTALAYLPSHGERDNLTIRCGTEVAEVLFSGTRAVGVRLLDGEVVNGACIVLCAGTYGSAALLMRSGVGPESHLRQLGIPVVAELAGVGSNLADHPFVAIEVEYRGEPTPTPLFQNLATWRSPASGNDHHAPDLQFLTAGPYPATDDTPARFVVMTALLRPRSRGTVRLGSPDPKDPPRINLGYFSETADMDVLLSGLAKAEEVADHPELRALATAAPTNPPSNPAERRAGFAAVPTLITTW